MPMFSSFSIASSESRPVGSRRFVSYYELEAPYFGKGGARTMGDDGVDLLSTGLKQNLTGRFNGGTGIGHVVNKNSDLKSEPHG